MGDDRDGALEQRDDGGWRLRFTRRLPHPIETVWRAVTEAEHLAHWFPSTIEGGRVPGAPLRFAFPDAVGVEPLDGTMLAYEPPHLIEFRWGPDVLRIELSASDDTTELTLVHALDELGKAARDGAGWHTCLDALEASLDHAERPREQLGRWAEHAARYRERFGPQASTIGPPEGQPVAER